MHLNDLSFFTDEGEYAAMHTKIISAIFQFLFSHMEEMLRVSIWKWKPLVLIICVCGVVKTLVNSCLIC